MRDGFRNNPLADFDKTKIARTLEFLEHARSTRGFEHKLLKNLLFVWGRRRIVYNQIYHKHQGDVYATRFQEFDETVGKLNKSLGLCLR